MDDDRRDALYDAYLDAVERGDAPTATAFLAAAGETDAEFASQLDSIRLARGTCSPDEETTPRRAIEIASIDDPWIGRTIGGFRIEARIGEGGMGIVYRATEWSLDRPVALKLLRPEVAGSPAARARFEREAKAVARLHHANIVNVYSVGDAEGVRFLAMELVDGRSLDELLREAALSQERLPTTRLVPWIRDLADALQCAHEHGIVHRDVKTSNILITLDDRALLVDFGIARDTTHASMTVTDAIVGSPHTMPPERIGRRDGVVTDDPRSDVYGLGVVLWECLAGRPPFDEPSLERLFQAILTADPPRLRTLAPQTSRDLETIVAKAMDREPARRYSSAAAFRDDLAALLAFRPIVARPEGMVRRSMRRARRHPTLVVAIVAIVLSITAFAIQTATQRTIRRLDAERSASKALALIDDYRVAADATLDAERAYEGLAPRRVNHFMSDDEDRQLDALESDVRVARESRDAIAAAALSSIADAERSGVDPERARGVRARLHAAQHEDAVRRGDQVFADTLRTLVRDEDREGSLIASIDAGSVLSVRTEPPDASLFLYRVQDGRSVDPQCEPRLIAVPWNGPAPILPDTWCLLVTSDAPPLATGDLIESLDGESVRTIAERIGLGGAENAITGARSATCIGPRGESTVELAGVALPPNTVRLTTRPLPRVAGAALDVTPVTLRPGHYVLVATAPGRVPIRVTFASGGPPVITISLTLPELASQPPGFLPILLDGGSHPEIVWLMEREVTVGEYLAFVNDPEVLARVNESVQRGRPVLVPRSASEGIHCPRDGDGRFVPPPDWTPEWPALGISWNDAQEYVAWRNRRAELANEPWRYALPTYNEWVTACGTPCTGTYLFGDAWRPKWISSVFSKPKPEPSPVRTFPRDESFTGVRDLAGGVCEHVDDWWREDVGHRRHLGGCWAFGEPTVFRTDAGNGMSPMAPGDIVGVRLKAIPVATSVARDQP